MHSTSTAPRDATDIDRGAFNAAFYELGLRWYWDESTYDGLAGVPDEGARLRRYMQTSQPHLLRAYDPAFLTTAILDAKARCEQRLSTCAPSSVSQCDWTDPRSAEIGV